MPYIDSNFYLNVYKGLPFGAAADLDRLILRANDVMDLLTNYIFVTGGVDFNTYNSILKTQVQKATAALVEHYVRNGGYDAAKTSGVLASAGLGSFNFSLKGGTSVEEVPADVLNLLYPTGLLYTGVEVH
jgi:hypothetical protein